MNDILGPYIKQNKWRKLKENYADGGIPLMKVET